MTDTKLRLRRDAELSEADGVLRVTTPGGSSALRGLPPGTAGALRALAAGDVTEADLTATVVAGDGEAGLLRWHMLVRRLGKGGLLEYSVDAARLRPVGAGPVEPGAAPGPGDRVRLSRFAVTTAEDGVLAVRSPRHSGIVELAPDAAAILGALAGWTTPAELAGALPGLPVGPMLRFFAAAGLLAPTSEDETQPIAQWSPRDLWLHAHSRGPRVTGRYGGTYPLGDRFGPMPSAPPAFGGPRIDLSPPDLEVVAKADPSLTETLERRRSLREHDPDDPITVDQLGELLYRSMRRRDGYTGSDGQELVDRPYPSGGSVHELEVYPLVVSCQGAEPGLWHYDTAGHALERVAEPGPATAILVERARSSAVLAADPQVVLIVTARFGRVMWKYETIAYSLVLKHVGVLYQTLYLVGTAMGLAVCGLGGGDAEDFAAASGLDYYAEGSVGELVLGSKR
ncbi:SagB family peptide dehydrogenase [Sphaerisporangium corydalis]|uniref:SagB family peptide dehydrogenase n=1 Tax=Sphaerisporangium corydalis TaxID=1441875 RepID=A0ABV9EKE4_9ACTN|nr:SagB family peptide dehydrogenase [Sphaerisporangium corydalis]